jgi:ABC-type transport system substrate-binding protein
MKTAIILLSVLMIAILGIMVVPGYCFVNPNTSTPPYNPTVNPNYELYGPHVAGVDCIIYTSQTAEWTAMAVPNSYGTGSSALDLEDWALSTTWIAAWTNTKSETVQYYGGENGYFVIDMNNNATQGPPDTGTINPFADFHIREAIAYLVNRTYVVTVVTAGLGLAMYTVCPTYMTGYDNASIVPGNPTFGSGPGLGLTYSGLPYTATYANSNPAQAAAILESDPYLCWNGSQPGTVAGTWYDDYAVLGTWAKLSLLPMNFYIRNDDPERLALGTDLYTATQSIPGLPALPITPVYGPAAVIETPVMYYKDFGMYTGAWTGIGPTPDVFFDLYAQEAYWPLGFSPNYDHCAFDNTYGGTYPWATNELPLEYWLTQDFTASTNAGGATAAENAEGFIAQYIAVAPVYCHAGYKAVSNTPSAQPTAGPWEQMVNLPSVGFNNWYTLLDAVDPTAADHGDGLYINYGFKSTINMQNILYYSWYWDSIVLGEIYDSGATLAPDFVTWVPQLFSHWAVGTWTGPFGTCSYVNLTLRPDVYWQDGVPVTMADVMYTLTECGSDLLARGLPPPWWWPVVSYFVSVEQIDAYNVQILLNVKSYWALAWVISSIIIPKHIWQPMINNYPTTNPTVSFADPFEIGSGPYRFESYSPGVSISLEANTPSSTVTQGSKTVTSPGYYQYYPVRIDIDPDGNLARIGIGGSTRASLPAEVQSNVTINLYNLLSTGTITVNKYVYWVNDTSMAKAAADLATAAPISTTIGLTLAAGGINITSGQFQYNLYDVVPQDTELFQRYDTLPNAILVKVALYITADDGVTLENIYGNGTSYVNQWINSTQPIYLTFSGDVAGSTLYADLALLPAGSFSSEPVPWSVTTAVSGEIPTPDFKVDGRDITIAAKAFGTVPGSPRWNPVCDVNHDYKIDGRDITIIAKQFGWH